MADRPDAFAELDGYLAGPFSTDYWFDDAIGYAETLVAGLSADAWDALAVAWRARPPRWQARAAQALSHDTPARAVPVLVAMVDAADDDVAGAAADALRDFGSPEAPLTVPPASSSDSTAWPRRAPGRWPRRWLTCAAGSVPSADPAVRHRRHGRYQLRNIPRSTYCMIPPLR
jgi:hypothetical protein